MNISNYKKNRYVKAGGPQKTISLTDTTQTIYHLTTKYKQFWKLKTKPSLNLRFHLLKWNKNNKT